MKNLTPSRRTFLSALSLTGLATTSGCIGSFGLTDMLFSWNKGLDGKWLQAIIFFLLLVIPVYGLFLFVDAIVLNTIEFWTGSNPVSGKRISKLGDGREVATTVTDDPNVLRHELRKDGEVVRVIHARRTADGRIELLDGDMGVVTAASMQAGRVEVRDGSGDLVLQATQAEVDSTREALARGALPSEAVGPLAQRWATEQQGRNALAVSSPAREQDPARSGR